jgi:bacteriocin biosynthesis cyclodehydratase domain-containing protein
MPSLPVPSEPSSPPQPAPGAETSQLPAAPPPRRLVLRPGVHVLRRLDGQLQVGLQPAGAVVLPDDGATRAVLDRLDGSPLNGPPASPPASLSGEPAADGVPFGALDLLVRHDLVTDAAAWPATRGDSPAAAPRPEAAAALLRHRGDGAAAATDRRGRVRLEAVHQGPGSELILREVLALVARLGLPFPPYDSGQRSRVRQRGRSRDGERLGLLVAVGEPDRERLDPWVRDGVPHLVVRMVEGTVTVGPFVTPGSTACLRCIDAHHADADPSWPVLVAQYARAVATPRDDGVPEPRDPALAAILAGWAARDLVTVAEGGAPATWSTTLVLDAVLRDVESRSWLRHPDCGCSWE